MGNAHLSLFPYEPLPTGDGDLIVVAGNDGQFRQALPRARHRRSSPTTRASPPSGSATTTAKRCGRCCSSALATRSAQEWFEHPDRRRLPCGPINDVRGGVELAERARARPGGASPATSRRSATRSGCRPRPPATTWPRRGSDAHGDEIRAWLGSHPTRAATDDRRARREPFPTYPTSLGMSTSTTSRCSARTSPRDLIGQGQLRRAGLPADHAGATDAAAGPGLRGGAGRARRPRLHPDRDRGPAHLPQRPGRDPGRARRRPARRRLPLPRRQRGHRRVPGRRPGRPATRCRSTTPAGTTSPRQAVTARRDGRAASCPGWATPAQERRSAHAGAHRDRARGGRLRRRTSRCSRRSAGCTRTILGPHPAAQRRRRLRRRPRRPRPAAASCCAASCCSPAAPGCSATSPRRSAGRSRTRCTSPSTATPSTSRPRPDPAGPPVSMQRRVTPDAPLHQCESGPLSSASRPDR